MTLENNFLLELLTSKLRAISDQLMLKCLPLCTLLGPTRTSVRDRPKFSLDNSTIFSSFFISIKSKHHMTRSLIPLLFLCLWHQTPLILNESSHSLFPQGTPQLSENMGQFFAKDIQRKHMIRYYQNMIKNSNTMYSVCVFDLWEHS